MSRFGAQDMVSPLRRVMMKRPDVAMAGADPQKWHYAGPLDLERVRSDHAALVSHIQNAGAEVLFLDEDPEDLADAVFTHDPSLVTTEGAVVLRLGKPLRRGEEDLHAQFYNDQRIPVVGTITEPGTVEAGDCIWLDPSTLIVGLGFRTNQSGLHQLSDFLSPLGVAIHGFDLPVYQGADACLHLMSMISMLDHDLALTYQPLLPVRLRQLFDQRGIRYLAGPEDEFQASGSLSLNVLA
ncbi:MAG: arginine deiminase family protein, partial [Pirellulales bacterium]